MRFTLQAFRSRFNVGRLELLSKWVPFKVRWIKGTEETHPNSDDLVVVCLVRNGETQIASFVNYYLEMGVKNVILVDNDSTDNTLALCRKFDKRVIILSCNLDYKYYQVPIKMWLTSRFGRGCWCLVADIDEYFDYPLSFQLNLKGFLNYLNTRDYSGVICQSIDLFTDEPMSAWPESGEDLRRFCVWYDHSMIIHHRSQPSFGMNRISTPKIQPYSGGVKKIAFNVDRLLTKHVLIFPSKGVYLTGPHHSWNANIADLSCAILHYPFRKNFYQKCIQAVAEGKYWEDSKEYKAILNVLETTGAQFSLKQNSAKKMESLDQLIKESFLIVSNDYINYVKATSSLLEI